MTTKVTKEKRVITDITIAEMKEIAKRGIELIRKQEATKLKEKTSEERKRLNAKYDAFLKQINAL
ncbi:hypothetical protein LK413_11290 [Prevotella melaninogenica]|uniref:hypothetical protein n=1 Tax=Prevotella melaninogenica TaxID=28132 RepID=UPI001D15507C|nr:hypothetical protein [Prevotella melaninogenica]UEB00322.1 hypothetical protein LK413_11290 [Prevotella melaninogenica]